MPKIDTVDETIWTCRTPGETPYPDLDANAEREARATYSSRKEAPGTGYATCYRCANSAAAFVALRVSSMTPICREHLEHITYAADKFGTLTEAGPYCP